MNKSYKLTFSKKRGELIVASELAKGAKKATCKKISPMAVALLLLLPLSQNVYAETVYLDNSYHAAQLNWKDRGKRLVDKTDPIREEQTAGNLILNTAGDHDITFKQKDSDEQVRVINGTVPEESDYDDLNYGIDGFYVRQYFDALLNVGVAAIYKKDADGNLQKTDLREVEWIDAGYKDGEFQDLDVTGSGSEYRYLLGQPVIAYYKLNMVTAQQGTMNFNDEVKWDFKQAKGSRLFVAEDNAHINVKENANIDVDFGEQHHVLAPNLEAKRQEELGTTKVWNKETNLAKLQQNNTGSFGAFYSRDLDALRDTILNSDKEDAQKAELYALVDQLERNYAVLEDGIDSAAKANSAKDVIEINQQLGDASILGSFNNTAKERYIKTLENEAITRINGDYVAVVEEKDFNDTTHYINEAMMSRDVNTLFVSGNQSEVAFEQGSQVKVRNGSILNADNSKVTIKDGSSLAITGGTNCDNSCGSIVIISGNDAVLTIEEGANLKVEKGTVVNASNGAKVTNNTAIELNNGGSNANIVNAEYTQKGDLYFNMTPDDQKTTGAIGDNVSGKLSTYTNLNNIYSTGLSASNGATIAAGNGATVTNHGNIYIAALSKSANNLSDGILLKNNTLSNETTTFINETDGLITVGYYKDENGELTKVNSVSGTTQSLMDLRYRAGYINNAILVNGVKNSTSKIVVDQKGTIMLGNLASGINFNQGYDDNATVNNSGKIYIDGDYSVGMRINNGLASTEDTGYLDAESSSARHTGLIDVAGKNSTGLYVSNNAVAEMTGEIKVKGTDSGTYVSYGAYVDHGKLILNDAAKLTLSGTGAVGVRVVNGGVVNLDGVNNIYETGDDENNSNLTRYWISGFNNVVGSSHINFGTDDVNLTLAENYRNSTLIRVDDRALFGGDSNTSTYTFNVNSEEGVGLDVANQGTRVEADGKFIFNVKGDKATGIRVTSGAGYNTGGIEGKVFLSKDAKIKVSGIGATAALIDGRRYDNGVANQGSSRPGAMLISEAMLCSIDSDSCKDNSNSNIIGKDSYGYVIINGGYLDHKGKIDLTNTENATAIYIDGGTLNNQSIDAILVGAKGAVGVDVYGKNSYITNLGVITARDGIAAVRLNKGATLTVKGQANNASGSDLIQGSKEADAIRVHSGAKLTLDNANIKVDGTGNGINFMNAGDETAETGNIETFTLTGSGNILVEGDDATGIRVQGKDGTIGKSNFDSSGAGGLSIVVAEEKGNGIVTNITGYVKSGANVTIESEIGQSALIVKGNTTDITQSGKLLSNSESVVVDLSQTALTESDIQTFTNSGTISGKGEAVLGNKNKTHFINKGNQANITGTVILKDEGNTASLYGGAKAEKIVSGKGDDVFELVDVNGTLDQSKKLFTEIDGGEGSNTLVLKATSTTNNVETNPKSHYIFARPADGETAQTLKNIAQLKVENAARFELDHRELKDDANGSYVAIDIAEGGQLFINEKEREDSPYTFNNKLTGKGLVTTNLGDQKNKFLFTESNSDGDFLGTFAINNGSFDISGNNSKTLKNATLRLDGEGIATIKKGPGQNIGGLNFNGGTLVVEELLYGQEKLESMLTVDHLSFNKGGTIEVTMDDQFNAVLEGLEKDPSKPIESSGLLAQDRGNQTTQLVKANEVTGTAGDVKVNLKYQDQDNSLTPNANESSKQTIDIVQNNTKDVVAKGTYNVKAQTTKDNVSDKEDGIYLSYGLTEVDLLGTISSNSGELDYSKALNLSVAQADADGNRPAHYSDLEAKLTGSGDLVINTGEDVSLSLSNSNNDYTGKTYVLTGDLHLAKTGTLGKTSLLDIASGQKTVFDSLGNGNVNAQSIGQLNVASGAGLELGSSGELTIRGDQTESNGNSKIAGSLTGEIGSNIILLGKKLHVASANSGYNGDVDVKDGATLELNYTTGVGSKNGVIYLGGKLHLDNASGIFEKTINGNGANEVLVDNNSTVAFIADHVGVRQLNIGGASGDISRVIVTDEKHLAGTDGNSTMNVDIRKDSTLEFNTKEQHWVVNNSVSGEGDVYKTGLGLVELTQKSGNYTGKTTVENGFLVAGRDKDSSVDLASKELFIGKSGTFAGFGSVAGSVTNEGNFFVGELFELPDDLEQAVNDGYETADSDLLDTDLPTVQGKSPLSDSDPEQYDYLVKGDFINSGNIFLSNSFVQGDLSTGRNLKINGNYTANGGAIFMNTVLNAGHEATLTDKLIVDGNVIVGSDSTKLYISNAQGLGAYTGNQPDAIEVVSVGGKSDNNSFILGNKVAIGIYEYTLHKGSGENAESWYLDSYSKDFNPGLGVFMGNKETALGMFTMSLEDRMGNLGYTDPTAISNNKDYLNSAWVRIVADQMKFKTLNKSMSIKSQSYIVHLGMDVYNWTNEHDVTRRLGVMAGYGYADIKNRSSSGFNADGKIDQAYNVGLYGTYYDPNGFYIDGWVQHSWFKNKLSVGDASDSYRTRLWTLSLELGHNFNLTSPNNEGKQWRLQPQGQLMWHNYKMNDKVISSTGLAVTDLPGHTTVSRLGMKLIYANVDNSDRNIQPFVEINWYHSNKNKAIEFNDWYTTSNSAPKNRYELKVGAEGQYNKHWTIWGNVAAQFGKDDYSNYRGTLGVKYDF